VDVLEHEDALCRRFATGIRDGGDRLWGVTLSDARGDCGVTFSARGLADVTSESGVSCTSSVTSLTVSGALSELDSSALGIPKPGVDALCSPTTSPKNGCLIGSRTGDDTFDLAGDADGC
jgi:hypothetical protein